MKLGVDGGAGHLVNKPLYRGLWRVYHPHVNVDCVDARDAELDLYLGSVDLVAIELFLRKLGLHGVKELDKAPGLQYTVSHADLVFKDNYYPSLIGHQRC